MLIGDLPAELGDEAVALWHATGLTRPWNDPHADLARALRGPASTVLAATDERGRLVGTAMVGHDGHRGWLYYLAVAADERGRGVGRRLVRACEDWLTDREVPKVQLMVRSTNTAVVSFYTALGYQDGEVVVLGRSLSPPAGSGG